MNGCDDVQVMLGCHMFFPFLFKWYIIFSFFYLRKNLKIYILLQIILHFCVEWHGGQRNFGRVLKFWKQNRMAWRTNQFLGTQGYYGLFATPLPPLAFILSIMVQRSKRKNAMLQRYHQTF